MGIDLSIEDQKWVQDHNQEVKNRDSWGSMRWRREGGLGMDLRVHLVGDAKSLPHVGLEAW